VAAGVVLKLYLVGGTPPSERAILGLDKLRALLGDDADVQVVDLRDRPELAEEERIIATPLLVRAAPLPVRRVVGDLSDPERVVASLGLRSPR
jgi:circadian clock protein KaiB